MEILNGGFTQDERANTLFYIYYFVSNNFYYVGCFSSRSVKIEC